MTDKISRHDQILQSLAQMLENNPGQRITTAALAKQVGVSEAALYRHFPSKARMFEGLIGFIEETLISRVNVISKSDIDGITQCEQALTLILTFTQRNPGLARLLTGDALSGETDRLRARINQLFERLETQLKHIMRDAELSDGLKTHVTQATAANLMLAFTEGKIRQFVRSEFKTSPLNRWPDQWNTLAVAIFVE